VHSQRFIVFDLETTGLSPQRGDRVIEIGAIAVENWRLTEEFHRLIHTEKTIHRSAQRVHGYSNNMLSSQPDAAQVFPEFHRFIAESPLVAHNAAFDLRFLRSEFNRMNLVLTNRHYCTLKLCRRLYPQLPNHKLETVTQFLFGPATVKKQRLHRALGDSRLTAMVWLKMMEQGSV
jgi:DNA polymerase III epsilon subunit